jgi:hypothetical protein
MMNPVQIDVDDDDLRGMAVPLKDCMTVCLGAVAPDAVAALEARGYDQAPVTDASGMCVYGLVLTSELKDLLRNGLPLTADAHGATLARRCLSISRGVCLKLLLQQLGEEGAVLVDNVIGTERDGEYHWSLGLIAVADLNRQPLRAVLYRFLARAESGLEQLVRSRCSEPWEWLAKLGEQVQVRIIGYWELAKRQGIDVGPYAALTLTDLLHIVAGSPVLQAELAYKSRNDFSSATSSLVDLRNRVMHPVRPLVHTRVDVQRLTQRVENLEDLCSRVERACGSE